MVPKLFLPWVILLLFIHMGFGQKPQRETFKSKAVHLLLELAPIENTDKNVSFRVHIINTSSDTIRYLGYKTQPWWRQQVMDEESVWEEVNVGWFCAVRVAWREVHPGKKVIFRVSSISPSRNIRIGLDYKIDKTEYTAWSEKFTFIEEG